MQYRHSSWIDQNIHVIVGQLSLRQKLKIIVKLFLQQVPAAMYFAVVGISWQRLVWEFPQYSLPLSSHSTVFWFCLNWLAKEYAPNETRRRMENTKKFRSWEFWGIIVQWAPDGLAWWSLACTLVPMPRPLSLSLSLGRPHTEASHSW